MLKINNLCIMPNLDILNNKLHSQCNTYIGCIKDFLGTLFFYTAPYKSDNLFIGGRYEKKRITAITKKIPSACDGLFVFYSGCRR